MEDLTVGQLVRSRMHGGDRRLVLLFGAAGEVVNYSESHGDLPLRRILMGDVKPASAFRQGADPRCASANSALAFPERPCLYEPRRARRSARRASPVIRRRSIHRSSTSASGTAPKTAAAAKASST